MVAEQCPACGEIAVHERPIPFEFGHAGRKLTVADRQMHCDCCGNVSYAGAQITEHERAITDMIRQADGLLAAKELYQIRTKYRLKPVDLEKMLSIPPGTWARWERGKVPQSKAADKLICLLAEDPDVTRRLMEQAQIHNPEASDALERIEAEAWYVLQTLLGLGAGKPRHHDTGLPRHQVPSDAFATMRRARRQAAGRAEPP